MPLPEADLNTMQEILKNTSAETVLASFRESINQPYFLVDETGLIQDANQAFAVAMHCSLEEVQGKHFTRFLPDSIRPYALTHHQEFFSRAQAEAPEDWEYQDKAGNIHSFKVISSQIKLQEGHRLKMNILNEIAAVPPATNLVNFKRETRHMFKNTLQEISGLLQLQASKAHGEVRSALIIARQRSAVIATAFEQLYKYKKSDEIALSLYLEEVLKINHYPAENLDSQAEVFLNISNCYALGLLINEILNTYRQQLDNIRIEGRLDGDKYYLKLESSDSGKVPEIKVLGEPLFRALKQQIKAELTVHPEKNVLLALSFPL